MKTYDAKIRRTALTLLIMLPVFAAWGFSMSTDNEKVALCHVPPGNPENAHTIVIDQSGVDAHLTNHVGDHLGECGDIQPGISE